MIINEIIEKIEKVAPISISYECINEGEYDNSGLIVGSRNSVVKGVVVAIDISNEAIDLCLENNCNVIITHHPFIYYPIKNANSDNYKGRQLIRLLQNGISVYCCHLNMDTTFGGIDDTVAKFCGIDVEKASADYPTHSYGKVGKVKSQSLGEYVKFLIESFDYVHYLGEDDKEIKTVMSCCGQGTSDKTLQFAIANKVDAYISCDLRHHEIMELYENGIAAINLSHGESEYKAFKAIIEKLDFNTPTYYAKLDYKLK